MARITSRLIGGRGRDAAHMSGTLADQHGIVLQGETLILNLTDGERNFTVIFNPAETSALVMALT